YMLKHPEAVLGKHTSTGKMRGADNYNVEPTGDLEAQLAEAVRRLPANVVSLTAPTESLEDFQRTQAPVGSRPFEFVVHEGRLAQVIDGRVEPVQVTKVDEARIRGLLPVRAALREVYDQM